MKNTTILAVSVLLLAPVTFSACSSSSAYTVGDTITGVADQPDALWMSAVTAIQGMGGRVTVRDRASGTLVGMLDVEGRQVQLDVYLRTPSRMGSDLTDLDVRVSLVGDDDPGAVWIDTLQRILDEYLGRVQQGLVGLR
jgi:hypothetical protein